MKPLICWVGSKARQWKNLKPIFDKIKRTFYVEPFGGSGAVFLCKEPEPNEVYNDNNKLLVNLFTAFRDESVAKTFYELSTLYPVGRFFWHELHDICKTYLRNESELQEKLIKLKLDRFDTKIVVAFAFFYVMRNSFAGVYKGAAFAGGCKGDSNSGTLTYRRIVSDIEEYKRRFENVLIENVDAFDCLKKYDHTKTFFYVDPPYEVLTSKKYDVDWTPETTERLVDTIKNCSASVVLSCYDNQRFKKLLDSGFCVDNFRAFASSNRVKGEHCIRTETVYYRLSDYAKEVYTQDDKLF